MKLEAYNLALLAGLAMLIAVLVDVVCEMIRRWRSTAAERRRTEPGD